MKRTYALLVAVALGALAIALTGCQKAPELTLTGPATVELSADGSSGTITFTANRDWTASASDSWVRISPASGAASDKPVTVSVSCDPNTTYEDRTSTVVIKAEGLTQSVTVKQPANLGLIVPAGSASVELPADAKTFEIEVQANVQYTVAISADWVKQTGTKALTSNKLSFSAEENPTYDERSATITLSGSGLSQSVTVKQAAKAGLEVEKTEYEVEAEGGSLEVAVKANVELTVTPAADWIHYTATKALDSKTVALSVDANETAQAREGQVEIAGGGLSTTLTVRQAANEPPYLKVTSIEQTAEGFEASWETNVTTHDYFGWMLYRIDEGADDGIAMVATGGVPKSSSSLSAVEGSNKSGDWNETNETWYEALKPGYQYYFSISAMLRSGDNYTVLAQNDSRQAWFVAAGGSGIPEGAVDLGLSVYWAECNLGASTPEQSGGFYAWGYTEPGVYDSQSYKWSADPSGFTMTKYNDEDHLTFLLPEDDAAHVHLGGKWRMPTDNEAYELFYSSAIELEEVIQDTGVCGIKVINKDTGEFIFLPASGFSDGTFKNDRCLFWTSELSASRCSNAYYYGFTLARDGDYRWIYLEGGGTHRSVSFPIRPVCDKE